MKAKYKDLSVDELNEQIRKLNNRIEEIQRVITDKNSEVFKKYPNNTCWIVKRDDSVIFVKITNSDPNDISADVIDFDFNHRTISRFDDEWYPGDFEPQFLKDPKDEIKPIDEANFNFANELCDTLDEMVEKLYDNTFETVKRCNYLY